MWSPVARARVQMPDARQQQQAGGRGEGYSGQGQAWPRACVGCSCAAWRPGLCVCALSAGEHTQARRRDNGNAPESEDARSAARTARPARSGPAVIRRRLITSMGESSVLIALSSSLISHLESSSASWCHMNCFSCPFLSLHSATSLVSFTERAPRWPCTCGSTPPPMSVREKTCASRQEAIPAATGSRVHIDKGEHGPVALPSRRCRRSSRHRGRAVRIPVRARPVYDGAVGEQRDQAEAVCYELVGQARRICTGMGGAKGRSSAL